MTKVVFIRHGQTEWNIQGRFQGQSDIELTEEGRQQAELLAEHFPLEHIDAVYSSDLKRAMFTAKAVADKFGLEVQPEKAFRELSFGDYEGLTYKEIAARDAKCLECFWTRPDLLHFPNGETFEQVQQRAIARLQEILAENDGKTIVIAAHGAVLRTILATAMHIDLRYAWHIRQFNTAVNIVKYDDNGEAWVELINSTAHLGKAL